MKVWNLNIYKMTFWRYPQSPRCSPDEEWIPWNALIMDISSKLETYVLMTNRMHWDIWTLNHWKHQQCHVIVTIFAINTDPSTRPCWGPQSLRWDTHFDRRFEATESELNVISDSFVDCNRGLKVLLDDIDPELILDEVDWTLWEHVKWFKWLFVCWFGSEVVVNAVISYSFWSKMSRCKGLRLLICSLSV